MSAFSPVRTRRTFEEAVEQIAERISLGELSPGDQLPSERTLAQQMEISRPTVREALKVLATRDMALHVPRSVERSLEIHQETLDAIRSGDMRRVDEIMDVHLAQLEGTWEQESGRSLVRAIPDFLKPVAARGANRR